MAGPVVGVEWWDSWEEVSLLSGRISAGYFDGLGKLVMSRLKVNQ